MTIQTQVQVKTVIETEAFIHNGILKTHPCELYAWWGNSTCQKVDFTKEIESQKLPEGEYKITITLEKK